MQLYALQWIEVRENGTLPSLDVRRRVYKILDGLFVDAHRLESSDGLGKQVCSVS
jgi:hypothetical protein